jgi:translation initiation factor 1 (eIF-1/SUI1)
MGVIIKYLVEFPDVSLKVSNDIIAGDYTLDASVTIAMKRGTDGCSFEISLFDLPPVKQNPSLPIPSPAVPGVPALGRDGDQKSVLNKLGKKVTVSLGYFDGTFAKVMDGIIDSTTATVSDGKLVTTVKGLETAVHALKQTPFASTFKPNTTVKDAIQQLVADATIKGGEITLPPKFSLPADDSGMKFLNKTAKGDQLISGIDNLVSYIKAEMLICDKTIRVGKPVTDDYAPNTFVPGISLGKFEPYQKEIPDQKSTTAETPLPATTAGGFSFAVIGDPKMRPAQAIKVELDTFSSDGVYRIQELTHKFSTSTGYTCEGVVMKVVADDNSKRREAQVKKPTAESIVDGLGKIASAHRKQSPSIEIGQIKSYTEGSAGSSDPTAPAKNTASVYYGQLYDPNEMQPSIHVPVQNDDKQVANGKPVVSPFAWHKCGLVVPIYPGMKTVLSHDLALEDDSLITGFIWSQQPAFDPPPNKKGDWWLSLPVFTSDNDPAIPPPDDTKIANDLTAKSGLRVIEVNGLKITIGKMQTLGTRPTEGSSDEFLIEHKKASIHIASDGSIEILADADGGKGKISIASGGDISMSATGGVTLKVGASAVEIS